MLRHFAPIAAVALLTLAAATPARAVYSTTTMVWSPSEHRMVEVRHWHLFHPHPVRRMLRKL